MVAKILKENIHWIVFMMLVVIAIYVLQVAQEIQGTPPPLYYIVLGTALIITILAIVWKSRC